MMKALWIGFVFLLACSCLGILIYTFTWEDSPNTHAAGTKPFETSPTADQAATDFAVKSGGGSSSHAASKTEPVDEKKLKGLESKFGLEKSPILPLEKSVGGDAPPLVPTQSVKQGR